MKPHRSAANLFAHHQGFTLLEMIVAAALLAVLMSSVLSVLQALLRESRAPQGQTLSQPPESLMRLLRRDVINARAFRLVPNGVELLGHLAQDGLGQPLLTTAIVQYAVRPTANGGLLERRQLAQATNPSSTTALARSQPLWHGIGKIGLTTNLVDERDVSLLSPQDLGHWASGLSLNGDGWQRLSSTADIVLLDTRGQVAYRESIVQCLRVSLVQMNTAYR